MSHFWKGKVTSCNMQYHVSASEVPVARVCHYACKMGTMRENSYLPELQNLFPLVLDKFWSPKKLTLIYPYLSTKTPKILVVRL